MKLIFVRHAEPDYTIDSLTEKGWREAEILSHRVAKWKIKDIYCSPLGRAKDTASLSLKALGREAEICEWLQEFYFTIIDEETAKPTIAWDFLPDYFIPNGDLHDKDEWYNTAVMKSGDIAKHYFEVTTAFDKLLAKHGYRRREDGVYEVVEHNDDVLVFFCHFGITSLLTGYLTGIAPPTLWQGFFMAPTSISVIGSEERKPGQAAFRVQVYGDASHLTEAGEPLSASGYFTDMFGG